MTFLERETALHSVESIYEKGLNVSPFTGLKIFWICQNSKYLLLVFKYFLLYANIKFMQFFQGLWKT